MKYPMYFYADRWAMGSPELVTGVVNDLSDLKVIFSKYPLESGWTIEFSNEPYDYVEGDE